MSEPFHLSTNLGRLGQAGDEIGFSASAEERAALARLAEVLEVPSFAARIGLKKLSPNRFLVSCALTADVVQACVVSLEPVPAHIEKQFRRELHYTPNLRRPVEGEVTLSPEEEEGPEEIGSLHYDLAGPLVEEFLLALDPYPRAPGVAFTPPEDADAKPESPFAVLKSLKSGKK